MYGWTIIKVQISQRFIFPLWWLEMRRYESCPLLDYNIIHYHSTQETVLKIATFSSVFLLVSLFFLVFIYSRQLSPPSACVLFLNPVHSMLSSPAAFWRFGKVICSTSAQESHPLLQKKSINNIANALNGTVMGWSPTCYDASLSRSALYWLFSKTGKLVWESNRASGGWSSTRGVQWEEGRQLAQRDQGQTDDTVSSAPKKRQRHIKQFKPSVLLQ